MKEATFLYSGNCRMGTVGQPTPFKDYLGDNLFVGDIVITFTKDYIPDGLTAVVSDEFTSYIGGIHKIKDGPIEPFVMGIKNVDLDHQDIWMVKKIKDYKDVISGEHWPEYGFRYE